MKKFSNFSESLTRLWAGFLLDYDNLEYDEFESYATPCENCMSGKILILEINTDPSCNRFGGSLLPIFPNILFKWQVVMIKLSGGGPGVD